MGSLIKKTLKFAGIIFITLFLTALLLKLFLPAEEAGSEAALEGLSQKLSAEEKPSEELPFKDLSSEVKVEKNPNETPNCLPNNIPENISLNIKDEINLPKTTRKLEVKGIIFADLFGQMGSPEFNSAPKDPKCLSIFLEHALAGPLRIGAGWIGVVPAAWYQQVKPLPVIGTVLGMNETETNYHSLTDENYYAALISAAKVKGLKVVHTEQLALGLGLSQDQIDAAAELKKNPQWWVEWFNQWEKWVVQRAARAEKYGVEMFVLYLYPEDLSDIYPQFNTRWKKIISEVRKVYSGKIAVNFYGAPGDSLTYIDDLDAVLITADGNLYRFLSEIEPDKKMKDPRNPTVSELIPLTKRAFVEGIRSRSSEKLSFYAVLVANSADGQNDPEDPERRGEVDFQEQAAYYEAFFQALADEPVIKGVFTERWDWWDQFKRTGYTNEAKYFDATTGASPRSKPAEEVNKKWYNIY